MIIPKSKRFGGTATEISRVLESTRTVEQNIRSPKLWCRPTLKSAILKTAIKKPRCTKLRRLQNSDNQNSDYSFTRTYCRPIQYTWIYIDICLRFFVSPGSKT